MKKRFKIIILSLLAAFVFSYPFNLSYAVTAEDSGPCTATGSNVFSGTNTACRFTPQIYKAKVYEMGLCTVNPMAGASLDRSTCTTVFTATDQTNGSEHDFALGDVNLVGTSTSPATGTYQFPYIILSNVFSVKAEFPTDNGTGDIFYVLADGGGGACGNVDNTGPAAECTTTLQTFAQGSGCDGEYIGAVVSVGTLDGYLVDIDTLDKRNGAGEEAGGVCTNVDRLVGVMNLTTPVVITPSTIGFKFTFNVTGYGAQLFSSTAPSNTADGGGGSGPFSGFFTITEAPQQ